MIPKITLEQWAIFKAVVDEGSHAKAAEMLNKSQSTVSYMLGKMEARMPSPLFVQQGRKAALTEFGRAMYRHGANLLSQAQLIDQSAQYLASGWEAEITLAVDAIVSMSEVFCALQRFSQHSPQTRIRVLETTLSGTNEVLLKREADLVITASIPPGFLSQPYGQVTKVPVCSPTHALASETTISEGQLRLHRQIVVRDSGARRQLDSGWLGAEQRWTVSHFATSIEAVKAGLGFAFVPEEKIMSELESGALVRLPLNFGQATTIPLYLIASAQDELGPATRAVMQELLQQQTRRVD